MFGDWKRDDPPSDRRARARTLRGYRTTAPPEERITIPGRSPDPGGSMPDPEPAGSPGRGRPPRAAGSMLMASCQSPPRPALKAHEADGQRIVGEPLGGTRAEVRRLMMLAVGFGLTMLRPRHSQKRRRLLLAPGRIPPGELCLSHAVDGLPVADGRLMMITHRLAAVV